MTERIFRTHNKTTLKTTLSGCKQGDMYSVMHRWDNEDKAFPVERFPELLLELAEGDDEEHPAAAVRHESEWCLSYYTSRDLIWENVERSEIEPRHMKDVPPGEVLRLWELLSRGELGEIEQQPWLAGYGNDPE